MAKECFGGKETVLQRNFQTGQVNEVERDILKNAYILVYERKEDIVIEEENNEDNLQKEQIKKDIEDKDEENDKQEKKELEENDKDKNNEIISSLSANVPIPEDIMNKIWKENREFIIEKHIFDKNFFNFIWKLINLYTTPEYLQKPKATETVMQAIELATRFISDIYSRSKENQLLPMWTTHLCSVYEQYPTVREFFNIVCLL